MPRFEFQGTFYFGTTLARTQFGSAAQSYIDSHPGIFFGYTPINRSQDDHSHVTYQLVQARFSLRSDLDALFAALKTQAQTRGAIAPSSMWLAEIADDNSSLQRITSSAPAWTDVTGSQRPT
jgi:hypothetical protein